MKTNEIYLKLDDKYERLIENVSKKIGKNYFNGDLINVEQLFNIIDDLLFTTDSEEERKNENEKKN